MLKLMQDNIEKTFSDNCLLYQNNSTVCLVFFVFFNHVSDFNHHLPEVDLFFSCCRRNERGIILTRWFHVCTAAGENNTVLRSLDGTACELHYCGESLSSL